MQLNDTALLMIDIQNDYFHGGLNELVDSDLALNNTIKVLHLFRDQQLPIIHIQHISDKENPSFFIEGTWGVNIRCELEPKQNETVIVKRKANSFQNTKLDEILKSKNIKKLVVCGMMSHHCVDSSVRAAKDHGYEVIVIEEACATKDLEHRGETIPAKIVQKTFMAALKGFARVIEMEEFQSSMI